MRKRPAAIGDVLKNVFAEIEKKQEISEDEIIKIWKSVAGDAAFRHSRPESLKKKALKVRVDNSAWHQELCWRKRELLKGLKRALGKDKISEIHFKIGEF